MTLLSVYVFYRITAAYDSKSLAAIPAKTIQRYVQITREVTQQSDNVCAHLGGFYAPDSTSSSSTGVTIRYLTDLPASSPRLYVDLVDGHAFVEEGKESWMQRVDLVRRAGYMLGGVGEIAAGCMLEDSFPEIVGVQRGLGGGLRNEGAKAMFTGLLAPKEELSCANFGAGLAGAAAEEGIRYSYYGENRTAFGRIVEGTVAGGANRGVQAVTKDLISQHEISPMRVYTIVLEGSLMGCFNALVYEVEQMRDSADKDEDKDEQRKGDEKEDNETRSADGKSTGLWGWLSLRLARSTIDENGGNESGEAQGTTQPPPSFWSWPSFLNGREGIIHTDTPGGNETGDAQDAFTSLWSWVWLSILSGGAKAKVLIRDVFWASLRGGMRKGTEQWCEDRAKAITIALFDSLFGTKVKTA